MSAKNESVDLSTQLSVGEHAFTQMQGDLDQQRLLGERPLADPLDDLLAREMHTKERVYATRAKSDPFLSFHHENMQTNNKQ
uniref:Uncharacterized protein n=1 Tax=Timema poppense TaxID=170557 RepID=A0A7R9CKE4_TIMPO|nr:unnamed protein product [Timema poppensis]